MLGDWENWGVCEAQCDVGRRARRRPFQVNDVKHYTADLEKQVYKLMTSNERVEEQKNTLLLDITTLHRSIVQLQAEEKGIRASLKKESGLNEKLQANVSAAKWTI